MKLPTVMLNGMQMTSTVVKYHIPVTPEWDKAMHAQQETIILKNFLDWLRGKSLLFYTGGYDALLAQYFNIDLDKLADEQEQWATFDAFIQKELGLND
jgi:hypothetical protein